MIEQNDRHQQTADQQSKHQGQHGDIGRFFILSGQVDRLVIRAGNHRREQHDDRRIDTQDIKILRIIQAGDDRRYEKRNGDLKGFYKRILDDYKQWDRYRPSKTEVENNGTLEQFKDKLLSKVVEL